MQHFSTRPEMKLHSRNIWTVTKWCFASSLCITSKLDAQSPSSLQSCCFMKWSKPLAHRSNALRCIPFKHFSPTSPTFPKNCLSRRHAMFSKLFSCCWQWQPLARQCQARWIPIKQPNSTRQVRMTIATEIRLSFSSPLCCQNPWLCRTGNGTKKTRRHRWNGVLRSPLLNVKWASSSKSSLRMQVFVLLYPCSAAEGQIALAIFCHRGQILQSRFECCAFLSRAVRGLEISRHLSR